MSDVALIPAGTPVPDPIASPSSAGAALLSTHFVEMPSTGSAAQVATPQVAPALISLATRTDGSNEITVSLNPRDLGQVEVHLVRGNDGTTTVSITASNPETLQELSQNMHHLHAALDAANIPADGRTMNFMTASSAAFGQGQDNLTGRNPPDPQSGGSGASGGQDPGQGSARRQDHQDGPAGRASDDSNINQPAAPIASRRNWQLSGLNITA